MSDDRASDGDLPSELTESYGVQDGVLKVPAEDVLQAVELMLCEKGAFEGVEDVDFPSPERIAEIGDYVRSRSQKELYYELRRYDDPEISSAAKLIDPAWKPQTESTYEFLQYFTSNMTLAQHDEIQSNEHI